MGTRKNMGFTGRAPPDEEFNCPRDNGLVSSHPPEVAA